MRLTLGVRHLRLIAGTRQVDVDAGHPSAGGVFDGDVDAPGEDLRRRWRRDGDRDRTCRNERRELPDPTVHASAPPESWPIRTPQDRQPNRVCVRVACDYADAQRPNNRARLRSLGALGRHNSVSTRQ